MFYIEDINSVITTYTLIGCQSGCIHRGDNVIDAKLNKKHDKPWIEYISISINPICNKYKERAEMRSNIYKRADELKDLHLINKKSPKLAHKAWNIIADEWRNNTCPFFEKNT